MVEFGDQLSVCCGAPEHSEVEGMCAACHDWTSFEEEEAE